MIGEWDKIDQKPKFWSDSNQPRHLPSDDNDNVL